VSFVQMAFKYLTVELAEAFVRSSSESIRK